MDLVGLLVTFLASGFMLVLSIGMYLIQAITIYKISEKANVANRWLAFIPVLQFVLVLHIIDKSAWLILLGLVPFVNFVFGIYVIARFLQAFDMPIWVIICSIIIPFAYQISLFYLAFSSDARYVIHNRYA